MKAGRVLQAIEMVKSKLKVMEIEEKKVDKASEEVVEAEVVRVESPVSEDGKMESPDSVQESESSKEELPFK